MCKFLFILAPVALACLAGTSIANAASNTQMTITANVVAATCDVSVSNPYLDLGNYTPAQFTTVNTPVTQSIKQFTVGLSNCDTPKAASDSANLVISGQTLGGNPNIFNSTGTNTGVMISQTTTPGTYLKAGDKLQVAKAGTTPAASDFNGKSLILQAGVASTATSSSVSIGAISAPVLFSFTYN